MQKIIKMFLKTSLSLVIISLLGASFNLFWAESLFLVGLSLLVPSLFCLLILAIGWQTLTS